jgi:AcrR family transcriptional regulator
VVDALQTTVLKENEESSFRRSHARRNDSLITESAIKTISEHGWDATTAPAVAEAAGLTYGAIYGRFIDMSELGHEIWTQEVGKHLKAALTTIFHSLTTSDEELIASFEEFARPSRHLVAAIELVLAGSFDPALSIATQEIASLLGSEIAKRKAQDPSGVGAAVAVVTASVALGLLLISDRSWLEGLDLRLVLEPFAKVLRNPGEVIELPVDYQPFVRKMEYQSGSEKTDQLFDALATEIGLRGYAGATIVRICRRSKISSGFVYNHFENKLELFKALTRAVYGRSLGAVAEYIGKLSTSHRPAFAEAILWRELLNPHINLARSLALEANRLARYNADMRVTHMSIEEQTMMQRTKTVSASEKAYKTATFHLGLAVGTGYYLVPNLVPDIWDLPYIAVTMPSEENNISLGS